MHLLFWSAFLWLSTNLQGGAKFYIKKISSPNSGQQVMEALTEPFFFYISIGDTLFKAAMVYVCLLYLIPKLLPSKKHQYFIISLILLFSLTLSLSFGLEHVVSENFFSNDYFRESNRFLVISTVFHVGLLSLTLGYGFSRNWYKAERQKERLEKESLASELNMLKSQINPHFLFNTLNNIFALARKYEDPRLADSLAQLSHLMRYMLQENSLEFVPLEKEVKYIKDFIELQKLRFPKEKNESLSFEIIGDCKLYTIAPLLLIPFVENAFKFSPSLTNSYKITIKLSIENDVLNLSVSNTINKKVSQEASTSSGIGLKNVKRRLSLLYPDKHELSITEKEDVFFSIILKLVLSP